MTAPTWKLVDNERQYEGANAHGAARHHSWATCMLSDIVRAANDSSDVSGIVVPIGFVCGIVDVYILYSLVSWAMR